MDRAVKGGKVTRRTATRVEWLLVGIQLTALVIVLGPPDFSSAVSVFNYPTAQGSVALVTAILWLFTIVLIATVASNTVRDRASSPRRRTARLLMTIGLGACCLGVGVVSHRSHVFGACCGSMSHAQSALDGTR